MTRIVVIASIALAGLVACGDDGGGDIEINAPSDLTVTAVSGGAHLTWKDNSDNEAEFMIERKTGSGDWVTVDTVEFNMTQYHDASVMPGTTYVYRVMAMPEGGQGHTGAYSGEVMFTAPSDGASGGAGSSAGGGAGEAAGAGAGGAHHAAGAGGHG